MISTRLISHDRSFFKDVEGVLTESGIKADWNSSGAAALAMASIIPIDLLIIDENLPDMTCRQFIEKVIMENAMINCVIASPLTKNQFHQTYEGLGVLMQLTANPGRKEVQKLLERLKLLKILGEEY